LRQLRVLIEGLPPASAWHRRRHGHAWGDAEYLAALLVDAMRENTYVTARVAGAKPRRPKPVPRPGAEGRRTRTVGRRGARSSAEVMAYLRRFAPGSDTAPLPATGGEPTDPRVGDTAAALDHHLEDDVDEDPEDDGGGVTAGA
jgi:hypothetical protein